MLGSKGNGEIRKKSLIFRYTTWIKTSIGCTQVAATFTDLDMKVLSPARGWGSGGKTAVHLKAVITHKNKIHHIKC